MNGAAAERVKITVVRRASRICNQEEWQSDGSGASGALRKAALSVKVVGGAKIHARKKDRTQSSFVSAPCQRLKSPHERACQMLA